jgi:hypothetical protein
MAVSNPASEIGTKALGDPRWALIERIASSPHLKTSARLCDFLIYIADCAVREVPEEATEQQIGIRVFHRTPGYNSSEDSIVRTHARLLRQKLAAYFAEEGHDEPVTVEIPKGHYLPVFLSRHAQPEPALTLSAEPIPIPVPSAAPLNRPRRWPFAAGAVVLLVALAAAFAWNPWRRYAAPAAFAVDKFWQPFFSAADPPLVVFSNALFVGDSTAGLRYAPKQAEDDTMSDAENYVDTYTGIGELASVYTLTRLFDERHQQFILKRSLLMTWDEAKAKNLIFIGSTAENPSLRVLPSTRDFTMEAVPGSAGVINHNPRPGEPTLYSRPERPLKVDYAILALLPGVQPNRRMLIFSGLTTFGTQAAVEYVCNSDTAADLLRRITDSKGNVHPFEALLETTIGGGVPLETHLVTLRVH